MPSRCQGCGGVVGIDCFNPGECAWIFSDMAQRTVQPRPERCEWCSKITDGMTECIGICKGMRNEADFDERAEAWKALQAVIERQTHATTGATDAD